MDQASEDRTQKKGNIVWKVIRVLIAVSLILVVISILLAVFGGDAEEEEEAEARVTAQVVAPVSVGAASLPPEGTPVKTCDTPLGLHMATCNVPAMQCARFVEAAGLPPGLYHTWSPEVDNPETPASRRVYMPTEESATGVRYLSGGQWHSWEYGAKAENVTGWELCFQEEVTISYLAHPDRDEEPRECREREGVDDPGCFRGERA